MAFLLCGMAFHPSAAFALPTYAKRRHFLLVFTRKPQHIVPAPVASTIFCTTLTEIHTGADFRAIIQKNSEPAELWQTDAVHQEEDGSMEELRVMVVDHHETFRKTVADFLRRQDGLAQVREAGNGAEALELLGREPFDVVVTDLVMPQMDGYTLLESIARLRLSPTPRIIVATALARDDFVLRAVECGANFFLVKPYEPQNLLRHIREVCGAPQLGGSVISPAAGAARVQTMDERLGSLFLTIGIPAHIKGYQYLRQAVKMVVERPDLMSRITKELYPGIAKHFGTSASKVERAIRHAIEVAWNRGRIETLNSAFGCRVCTPEDKPTNGEFIAMIADKLSMERSA